MRDMVFKGATRPAMMMGVPIISFILVAGCTMMVGMWVLMGVGVGPGFIVLSVGGVVLFIMKMVSKHDDQKINQLLMQLRNIRYRANSPYWNGHSVSPIDYKRRS